MILASHLFLTNLNSLLSGIIYQRFDQCKIKQRGIIRRTDHTSVSVKRCFLLSFFVSIKQIAAVDFLSFLRGAKKIFLKKISKFLMILDSFSVSCFPI